MRTLVYLVLFPDFTIRHLNFLFGMWYFNHPFRRLQYFNKIGYWVIDVLHGLCLRTSRGNTRVFCMTLHWYRDGLEHA